MSMRLGLPRTAGPFSRRGKLVRPHSLRKRNWYGRTPVVSVALALDPAQAEPIARQVERALRQAIVTMRIRPGEMLSEQDIARRFGVSRQPVREAFIKLGEANLVRILPQRGTLVVKISRAAVEDARSPGASSRTSSRRWTASAS